MITPIIPPVVNLNGTSREALTEQLLAASDAIRLAQNAFMAAMPNGRDYQTYQTPGLISELARARHIEEGTKLSQAAEYIDALLVKVVGQ